MVTTNLAEYKSCGRAECEVKRTGACAEGHTPLDACPFYGQKNTAKHYEHIDADSEGIDVEENELGSDESENGFIDLPSGKPLTVSDVDFFLRRYPIRLITIVGDKASGKTTLICSIYEQFFNGSFIEYLFGGSKTLIGLDQRHHYSRFNSKLSVPDTPRTSYQDGLHFFHFSIGFKKQPNKQKIDLMLSDRAGEAYTEARDNTEKVSSLVELYKADQIVFLLDGEKVAEPTERANAFITIRQYIKTFLDEIAINDKSNIHVVTTKLDLIKNKQHDEQKIIYDELDRFKNGILKSFNSRVGKLSFSEISARNPQSKEFGVDKLLMDWIEHKEHKQVIDRNTNINPSMLKREFDMLLVRTPMESSL